MTYTKEEWEPAATEAAKIPDGYLRSAVLKAYIEIAELREEVVALRSQTEVDCERERIIAELREKLAAAEDKHRCLCDSTLKQERDRLRQALEEIQDLDRCVSTFQCRKVAFKALAQPEGEAVTDTERLDFLESHCGGEIAFWLILSGEFRQMFTSIGWPRHKSVRGLIDDAQICAIRSAQPWDGSDFSR